MLKYLLIFTLFLNQLLSFNSIKFFNNAIILCICDFGQKISLENGQCNCKFEFDKIDSVVKVGSLYQSKAQLCFELPKPRGDDSTKNFGSFDVTKYLNSYVFSEMSVFSSFLSMLKSYKLSGISLESLNNRRPIFYNYCQPPFLLFKQQKIIIRC